MGECPVEGPVVHMPLFSKIITKYGHKDLTSVSVSVHGRSPINSCLDSHAGVATCSESLGASLYARSIALTRFSHSADLGKPGGDLSSC